MLLCDIIHSLQLHVMAPIGHCKFNSSKSIKKSQEFVSELVARLKELYKSG